MNTTGFQFSTTDLPVRVRWADEGVPDLGLSDLENGLCTVHFFDKKQPTSSVLKSKPTSETKSSRTKDQETTTTPLHKAHNAWVPRRHRSVKIETTEKTEKTTTTAKTLHKAHNAWVSPSVRRLMKPETVKKTVIQWKRKYHTTLIGSDKKRMRYRHSPVGDVECPVMPPPTALCEGVIVWG